MQGNKGRRGKETKGHQHDDTGSSFDESLSRFTRQLAARDADREHDPASTPHARRNALHAHELAPALPAPLPVQVAQRSPRAGTSAARADPRPANPFDRLGRWLDSLVR